MSFRENAGCLAWLSQKLALLAATFLAMRATSQRLRRYLDGVARRRDRQTLDDYLNQWLELCQARGLRPATIASYRATLQLHVSSELRATALDRVTPQAVNQMYSYLLESGRRHRSGGLSARSVRYVHTLLKKAYADAVRLGYVDRNPIALTDPPTLKAARARVRPPWTPEELAAFLSAAQMDPLYPAYHLAAYTGMRRGEVLGLRWSDVDFEGRQLQVIQTIVEAGHEPTIGEPKSDRSRRVIALDDGTVAVLR
jgi:integrase